MELYAVKDDGSLGERIDATGETVRLEYRQQDGKWFQPRFKLKLTNNSDQRLYCALLDLTETFAVKTAGLLKGGGEWLEPKGQPGSEIWTFQGKPIPAGIPKHLRDQGVVSFRDTLKLIVSTTEVPGTLLERDDLGVATKGISSLQAPLPKSSLARLYNRVQTRGVGDEAPSDETITDWTASQVTITTVHPRDGIDVPEAGETANLSDAVTIEGHPALQASARLTTFTEGTRDAGNLALPLVFRQYPGLATPFQFSDYRDGAPGLSVLELHVQGDSYKEVTPENPLVVHVAKPVAKDEFVLPLAFDPEAELFLPLGVCLRHNDSTTIRIDRLPKPMSETRDLLGSIKLFFQKVVAEKLGLGEGEINRLAIARALDGGQVEYDASPVELATKVAAAQRILLYIHGFTGDTRGMVASCKGLLYEVPEPPPVLADRYDLILAFDYENINTPIEETAIELKKRLAAIGLGAGHGKKLDIVAHSLGCMVTRWFIEREGGNKVVRKAVLVGPPNAGTPWAKLEDWAIVGLGAAINGLAAVIWPPAAIPALVGTISSIVASAEAVDTTLDQLKPGSTFYKTLNASEDPQIPYVVVAGNTQKIHAAAPASGQKELELLEKLVKRLASKETRKAIADLVFFGKPNDTSISVESMVSLPAGRQPAAIPQEIPCDHVSYFATPVGLRTLAKALE
jgi:pimeloyl-ACP methyl ester carboxylesterase